ncbi:MAG: sugar phosphate isomerase/epimerase [Kiritimatiellae bacterium]|nr:sugar phosphate isomerase/epimerase [Kiritimatiellia bacterium]
MHVGLLTARFRKDLNFEQIVQWAGEAGFKALEVATSHLSPGEVIADGGAKVKKLLEAAGLRISSLAHYAGFNKGNTPEKYTAAMKEVITAAEVLGVDTVCTLAGFPEGEKKKMDVIREVVPGVFGPIAEEAAKRNVRIAFENWFATNLQHLDHFKALTEALPQENVGFNFDPSHLYWQQIDYLAAVAEFGPRIFHVHAKDVALRTDKRARLGVLEGGWWRYVIPGFGDIAWGRFVLALREAGYDGVLSIEHEDRAFEAKDGFLAGLRHLSQFV